jgi:hypothetical protein
MLPMMVIETEAGLAFAAKIEKNTSPCYLNKNARPAAAACCSTAAPITIARPNAASALSANAEAFAPPPPSSRPASSPNATPTACSSPTKTAATAETRCARQIVGLWRKIRSVTYSYEIVDGSEAVVQWFGSWPSFHDAEIIYLKLVRSGESILRVYPYFPDKPAAVDFFLEDVTDLELADFSGPKVIFSLDLEIVTDQTNEKAIRLRLAPCCGSAGRIDTKHVRVELVPGKSSDGMSQW